MNPIKWKNKQCLLDCLFDGRRPPMPPQWRHSNYFDFNGIQYLCKKKNNFFWGGTQSRGPPCATAIRLTDIYERLFELLDSYSPTNTVDAYSSCWTPIRRRIPWTLIRVAGLLFADEYRGRLFELLDSPTNTMDAYSSCWTPIRRRIPHGRSFELLNTPNRRRIPWTLIRVAGLLFADEYRGRLFELLDP